MTLTNSLEFEAENQTKKLQKASFSLYFKLLTMKKKEKVIQYLFCGTIGAHTQLVRTLHNQMVCK